MILRIIDANFNRVREALRVIEDITRFYDLNGNFSSSIRTLRHSFTLTYLKYFGKYPISSRNIRTDEGKTNPPSPVEDIKDVLSRNFFRAEEGLRCIEECSGIANPSSTKFWQKLRFNIYEIEQKVMAEIPERKIPRYFTGIYFSNICPELLESLLKKEFTDKRLSIIIIEPYGPDNEFVRRLKKLKEFFQDKLIIAVNRFDIVLAANIDGIHLEHGSLKVDIIRKFLPGKIIGITLNKDQKAKTLKIDNINYIASEYPIEKQKLLTDWKKNIKLYTAAILYPCHEFEKAMQKQVDGVIIKCCKTDRDEILRIKKLIRAFYHGKKT